MKIPYRQIEIQRIIGSPYRMDGEYRLDVEVIMMWLFESTISYVFDKDHDRLMKLKAGDVIDVAIY